ncbi:hypothetical protein [Laceyella tengchongensis]
MRSPFHFADDNLSELIQVATDIVQQHVPAPPTPQPPDPKEVFCEKVSSMNYDQSSSLEELKSILSELKAALLDFYQ